MRNEDDDFDSRRMIREQPWISSSISVLNSSQNLLMNVNMKEGEYRKTSELTLI